jgi:hypothetical protein
MDLPMGSRLVLWCLIVTGFVMTVAFVVWRDSQQREGDAAQPAAAVSRLALPPPDSRPESRPAPIYAIAPEAPRAARVRTSMPLPSAELDLPREADPVPDEEPTVDDLAGRQTPAS